MTIIDTSGALPSGALLVVPSWTTETCPRNEDGGIPARCSASACAAAEFNIWVDPEAAARVFQSGLDLTMVGLDVTHRALMTPAHAERLAAAGTAGKLVADLYGFYARFHSRHYGWEGAPVHDAVAMAHVIDGTLVTTRHSGVRIDTGPEPSRGRTHVDLRNTMGWEPNCHAAVDIEAARFLEMLIARISSLGRPRPTTSVRPSDIA